MTPMVNCVQGFDNTERVGLPGLEFVFTSPPSTSDRSLAATPSARHLGERCSGETQSRERYRRARARSRTCPLEWASSLFGLPAADWNHVIAYLTSDISYTSNFFLVNPQQISSVTVIVGCDCTEGTPCIFKSTGGACIYPFRFNVLSYSGRSSPFRSGKASARLGSRRWRDPRHCGPGIITLILYISRSMNESPKAP